MPDPAKHAAIDGTGWVRETLDSKPLTATGQIFRMSMYHLNGNYQIANRVQVFDPPSTISWEPGYDAGDGTVRFGGSSPATVTNASGSPASVHTVGTEVSVPSSSRKNTRSWCHVWRKDTNSKTRPDHG